MQADVMQMSYDSPSLASSIIVSPGQSECPVVLLKYLQLNTCTLVCLLSALTAGHSLVLRLATGLTVILSLLWCDVVQSM